MATQLQQSKDAVKSQQEAKQKQKQSGNKAKAKAMKKPPGSGGGPRPGVKWQSSAQLARALVLRNEMKRKEKKGGKRLVVIPAAFGRDAAGTDALQALRNKLALVA